MSKHPATIEHNYLKKVEAHIVKYAESLTPQNVVHVTIQHDYWCNALRGKGNKMCNCNVELLPYADA